MTNNYRGGIRYEKSIRLFMFTDHGHGLSCLQFSVNGANKEELKKADQAAYNFIVAQIKGSYHKLFKKVLIKDAQGILEAGRHANPGFEKEMGERYQIKRYSRHFDENKLYYYLRFYD
ncbi:hypothetical protein ACO1D0_00105 [Bacillus licheniformis]|uniref:hypothetical protein n=1 Tax=Bacillus licheniformis TaxID=1402 RepID=UPI003BF623A2